MMPNQTSLFIVVLCLCCAAAHGGFLNTILRRDGKKGDAAKQRGNNNNNTTAHRLHLERLDSLIVIDDFPSVTLSNDVRLPLIGAGIGNLATSKMESTVREGLKGKHSVRMFDTSHHSIDNEIHIGNGIVIGEASSSAQDRVEVHVITKVWYTHLGYDRTKVSVKESLEALQAAYDDPHIDLKVHVLLHWPKCYESIGWMDCEQEEEDLPQHVQQAGAAPHRRKDTAWKESWQALEDLYLEQEEERRTASTSPKIASIGISNFLRNDFIELLQMARIPPHIFQMNIHTTLHDPVMVAMCEQHNVHIQLYNIFQALPVGDPDRMEHSVPHAYHHLLHIAHGISKRHGGNDDDSAAGVTITPAQLILKWFTQHDMSVIPRASTQQRLEENSPVSLFQIPDFEPDEYDMIAQCMEAILTGVDLPQGIFVTVTFTAKTKETIVSWYQDDEHEVPIAILQPGETYEDYTYPHHTYRMYDGMNTDFFTQVTVDGTFGETRHFEY